MDTQTRAVDITQRPSATDNGTNSITGCGPIETSWKPFIAIMQQS